jgi:hypothetical protein
MMSGLPSALRVNAWKIAPETPSAAPISSAISMRGIRHSRTTTRSNEVFVPNRTPITSPGKTVYFPNPMASTAMPAAPTSSVATTMIARHDARAETVPIRTMHWRRPNSTRAPSLSMIVTCGPLRGWGSARSEPAHRGMR